MGHKEIIEAVEAWPSSPSVERNTLDALVALYHLIDERLPEKPMPVISTPPAPAVEDTPQVKPLSDIPVRFRCAEWRDDYVYVNYEALTGRVVLSAYEASVRGTEIYLSREDAIALAKSILATF